MTKKVFLSYNRKDTNDVQQIAIRLKSDLREKNMEVWYDDWDLQPGLPWQTEAGKALRESHAIVVFIGPNDVGAWQDKEIQTALSQQASDKIPVIPLILPKAKPPDKSEFAFLQENTWINFSASLENEREYGRLLWGITGDRDYFMKSMGRSIVAREPDPSPPPGSDRRVIEAIEYLNECFIDERNATYFLGAGAAQEGTDPDLPPRVRELTQALFTDLGLLQKESEKCLLATVDTAGLYYSFKKNEPGLERKVKDLIMGRSRKIPPVYIKLAYLLALLQATREEQDSTQLIVTTNFDLLIECALLLAGLSFTRIVQDRSGKTIHVGDYTEEPPKRIDGETLDVFSERLENDFVRIRERGGNGTDETAYLSKWISTYCATKQPQVFDLEKPEDDEASLKNFDITRKNAPPIVLYKFHGSLDIKRSFAFSTDHYLKFIISKQRNTFIPKQIAHIIASTPSLFLGYGPLDPDLRLTYYMMRELINKADERYAIPLRPLGEETRQWGDIKERAFRQMRITALEDGCEGFIEKLIGEYAQSQY